MSCAALAVSALDMSQYADTSRLATGKWVKVAVSESGIYQITSSDASKWGFNDLSRVRVFGYGGAQINDTLRTNHYVDDLPQVPVLRTGDRILFYAQGPLSWNWSIFSARCMFRASTPMPLKAIISSPTTLVIPT